MKSNLVLLSKLLAKKRWGCKYLTTAVTSDDTTLEMAKTSVWWDIENCGVPKSCDGQAIEKNIRSTLRECNYRGSLSIHAYGDMNQIPSNVQKGLSSTGVSLNHVPPSVKDASDKKIIVDMLLWAMENQAPANIMLISGDGDFSYVLYRLRMKRYNVLLIRPDPASPLLTGAANKIWLWKSIVVTDVSSCKPPKQAEPSKCKNSDPVVKSKSSETFCETCNVSCTSLADFNSHLASKKHKRKVAAVADENAKGKPKAKWCDICKVQYPAAGHEEHISGRSHKNKVKIQTV